MTSPPLMTDLAALAMHRARADKDAMFLHHAARDEVQDRVGMVNKSFTDPALVTGFPEVWVPALSDAVVTAPDDRLALEPAAHDLVVHAMALHWANDPIGQLIQCRRALRADGLFLAVSFGGQTLHELRACLAQAESDVMGGLSPRVAPMAELRDMGALLQRAGFALPVADVQTLRVTYRDAWHLMRDLRAMGENNALFARLRKPTARGVMSRAASLYSQTFATPEGRITATFDMIFLTGWAPSDHQPKPLRPGSAKQRLADALKTDETKLPI
ncbi:SAM-dependent methyltransferase [Sulfitobacter aestuariivivens]|uniref:SAM-dependent methyltransferase n=1 Tax=Sulfitobacter aestuariivivens TaxID=2766981 RepID=A0A927D6T3_9RHOB|nr:SAM-dependent methyltransferase [Sulfitobacter aestuariivivens]MBD3665263.1 SAM-dependent methyltransferase [Sulfitobacter aestuariivivens]